MAPALSRAAAEKALVHKFDMERDERDHRWYRLVLDGQEVARTFVSTGTKYQTLGDDLVAKMAKQLRVPPHFFAGMVNCPKSKEDYISHLRAIGEIK